MIHWLRAIYIGAKVGQEVRENGLDGLKAGCGITGFLCVILPIVSYVGVWNCYGKKCEPPFGYIFSFVGSLVIPLALGITILMLIHIYGFLAELFPSKRD